MAGQAGFFDVEERLAGLSRKGDDLERLAAVVDFELFRSELEAAVPRADRSKGGRPPFDHVLMFKVLVLQTQNNLSDERTEFYLRDRLTWIRFLGLGHGDPVPDANTIWTFRQQLTKAGATLRLFDLFDRQLREAGYLAMSGQLVDASIIPAPKQRNTKTEKQAIKEERVPEAWQAEPAKLRQKDRDASPAKVSWPWHLRCWMIRLLTDHGRSSTPRPSRRRMGGSRSTWRSPPSATRTISAPTGGIA
jgi:IS5 family transposase